MFAYIVVLLITRITTLTQSLSASRKLSIAEQQGLAIEKLDLSRMSTADLTIEMERISHAPLVSPLSYIFLASLQKHTKQHRPFLQRPPENYQLPNKEVLKSPKKNMNMTKTPNTQQWYV